MNRQIVYNALRTPDGTILESHYTHDYKSYVDSNGKRYIIDGGTSYIRASANGDEEYLTVYADDPHVLVREVLTWRTYGKHGDERLKWVILKDITDEHLLAIIDTQPHLPTWKKDIFVKEKEYRKCP